MTSRLAELAALTTSTAGARYFAERTAWLAREVDCDSIYQGAVTPIRPLAPLVTGVARSNTSRCEEIGYWDDRVRLNAAARRAGRVAYDVDVLSATERRERPFYRDVMTPLRLGLTLVAVVELRGRPLSCIYFGWSTARSRRDARITRVRELLPVLALGETLHRWRPVPRPGDLGLSDREREIMGYVVRGLTNAEIATLLGTARATVKNQVAAILRKTGTTNRTELAWLSQGE